MSTMVSDLAVVPHLFKCPISLDVMKDPVTLSTGVTYDRDSIDRWFREGHNTCPLTMQPLDTTELTPNLTLRRLIQSWCSNNSTAAKNPPDDFQISNLLNTLQRNPFSLPALKSLQSLATTSSTNRSFIASSTAPCLLIRTVNKSRNNFAYENNGVDHNMVDCGETALAALAALSVKRFKQESLESLLCKTTMESVSYFLTRASSLASRLYAAQLLRQILISGNNLRIEFRPNEEIFRTLTSLIRKGAMLGIKSALDVLLMICPVRRNRCRAVNAGLADAVLEMLVDADRNICEKGLILVEILCQCAEGRAAVSGHRLGIHLLVKKIARVSQTASEAAASAFWLIYTNCKSPSIVQEMEEAGAYSKFFLLLQIGCSSSTRWKTKEFLREHKKNSSCVVGSPCVLVSNKVSNASPTHLWDTDANTLDMNI